MHTVGYQRLIEMLNLTGREYLDGFSSGDFVGLSDTETYDISVVLNDRAKKGDAVALDGLKILLPSDKYLHLLEELVGAQPVGGLFYAQVVTSICEMRSDDQLWSRLVDCLVHGDTSAKRWVLSR